MKYRPEDIFTPQGLLEEVEKNPNLDFLMNIFNIPRAFSVSGFGGNWNVGMHSVATAFIALFWAKFNNFTAERRDRFVTLSLLHDAHEAVTGDILPMFKALSVKKQLEEVQKNIFTALHIGWDETLSVDLKIVDLVAFLYEIKQVSPNMLNPKKLVLANKIAQRQREVLFRYVREHERKKDQIDEFLKQLDI